MVMKFLAENNKSLAISIGNLLINFKEILSWCSIHQHHWSYSWNQCPYGYSYKREYTWSGSLVLIPYKTHLPRSQARKSFPNQAVFMKNASGTICRLSGWICPHSSRW